MHAHSKVVIWRILIAVLHLGILNKSQRKKLYQLLRLVSYSEFRGWSAPYCSSAGNAFFMNHGTPENLMIPLRQQKSLILHCTAVMLYLQRFQCIFIMDAFCCTIWFCMKTTKTIVRSLIFIKSHFKSLVPAVLGAFSWKIGHWCTRLPGPGGCAGLLARATRSTGRAFWDDQGDYNLYVGAPKQLPMHRREALPALCPGVTPP